MYRCLYSYLLFFILPFSIAAATESEMPNNHFRAIEDSIQQSQQQPQSLDPLTAYPVAQYVVHGIVVSDDNAIAVIYTPRNTWHKLRIQSKLGQEQAVVQQITTEGIQIDIEGTLLQLPILQ